jgi:hypothetical protein
MGLLVLTIVVLSIVAFSLIWLFIENRGEAKRDVEMKILIARQNLNRPVGLIRSQESHVC